jgi:hypothetical protein
MAGNTVRSVKLSLPATRIVAPANSISMGAALTTTDAKPSCSLLAPQPLRARRRQVNSFRGVKP